jgi:hypothetical protein
MKKFVVARANYDGDISISFINAENRFEALKEYARINDWAFTDSEYENIEDLTQLFYDCDQAVEVEEIPE